MISWKSNQLTSEASTTPNQLGTAIEPNSSEHAGLFMVILKLKKAVINTSVLTLHLCLFFVKYVKILSIKNFVALHAELIEFKLVY